jgi:exodeoxyribonuclease VIII
VSSDLMIDLETLGTGPDAAIVSIGALHFDRHSANLHQAVSFYRVIGLEGWSHYEFGEIDASTFRWWLGQSKAAQDSLFSAEAQRAAVSPLGALDGLCQFIEESKPDAVWANSPNFDIRLLHALARRGGRTLPIDFRAERCTRTYEAAALEIWPSDKSSYRLRMDQQVSMRVPKHGRLPAHHSLGDCWRQAARVQATTEFLRTPSTIPTL